MKCIQPALSLFLAQIIEAQLVQEARVAMQESSGLHASITSKTENGLVKWANLSASLMPMVQATLQKHQPLTFHYMCQITEPKQHVRKGKIVMHCYHGEFDCWKFFPPLIPSVRSPCKHHLHLILVIIEEPIGYLLHVASFI